jgi:hypothetical protein
MPPLQRHHCLHLRQLATDEQVLRIEISDEQPLLLSLSLKIVQFFVREFRRRQNLMTLSFWTVTVRPVSIRPFLWAKLCFAPARHHG